MKYAAPKIVGKSGKVFTQVKPPRFTWRRFFKTNYKDSWEIGTWVDKQNRAGRDALYNNMQLEGTYVYSENFNGFHKPKRPKSHDLFLGGFIVFGGFALFALLIILTI